MEIGDILPNEVMHFRLGVTPPFVEVLAVLATPILCGSNITDRSVKPDIPIVVLVGAWDGEAKVGGWSGDIPVPQRFMQKVSFEVIGDFDLQVIFVLRPCVEKGVHRLDFNEEMVLLAENRWRATHRANWIDQVCSGVARTTFVTIVAVLIIGLTLWASARDKTVG